MRSYLHQAVWLEQMRFKFQAITGDARRGDDAFTAAHQFARETRGSTREAFEAMEAHLAAGLNVDTAIERMREAELARNPVQT